jgi:hypothetical protein
VITGAVSTAYRLTSADVAHTVRVLVTAGNSSGSASASSAPTATVSAGGPPAPPTNLASPAVTGPAVVGAVLQASTGSWSGSPTAYAYQWKDCNTKGESCTAIVHATESAYSLVGADVGHTLRVLVTASNAGGASEALSAASGVVVKEKSGGSTGCFADPEACGFPGPASTGPSGAGASKCSSFVVSGSKTVTHSGERLENLNIKGSLTVAENVTNVTVNNVCITDNAEDEYEIVKLEKGASGFTITNSVIRGANATTESAQEALRNGWNNTGAVASSDYIYNCGDCVFGEWKLTNSYVLNNGEADRPEPSNPNGKSQAHYENIYFVNSAFVAENDTLLNPESQTAVVFGNTYNGSGYSGACHNRLTVTNSLLAGGGYMFYPCGNATSVGNATMTIKNNRFARCLGTLERPYGSVCKGGFDTHGYYPLGGYYNVVTATYQATGWVWEGNLWDDNLASCVYMSAACE